MTRTVVCSLKPHGSVLSSVKAENFILIWLNCLSFFLIYIQRTKIILLSTKNCLSACKVLIVVFLFSRTGLIHFDLVCLRNWQNWWKFASHILLKMIWLKTLLLAYHQLMHCSSGRVFYFVFQWFNNHLSFIFIAMVTPTLCSPQKIKFGGFKCNLIWKTWSEHFSFHGDDSSQSAVDFTITNCLHKFKSKTQHNDQLLCEKPMLEYLEKISRLFLLVLFESHWRKTFSIYSLFVNFYTTKTLPIMR